MTNLSHNNVGLNVIFALAALITLTPLQAMGSDCITIFHYDDHGNVVGATKHGETCKGKQTDGANSDSQGGHFQPAKGFKASTRAGQSAASSSPNRNRGSAKRLIGTTR